MMEVEVGQKLIEFGKEKQMEAKKRLNEWNIRGKRQNWGWTFQIKDRKKLKK